MGADYVSARFKQSRQIFYFRKAIVVTFLRSDEPSADTGIFYSFDLRKIRGDEYVFMFSIRVHHIDARDGFPGTA